MRIISETKKIQDIPLTTFIKEGNENCPLVFVVHGLGNDKHQSYELAHRLAEENFMAVCPDAFMHGEREDVLKDFRPEVVIFKLFKIVERTANDINQLINYFSVKKEVNINKIGMTGISMGGFTTFHLISKQPKIKVAAPIIALPNFYGYWTDLINSSNHENKEAIETMKIQNSKEWQDYLKSVDPYNKLVDFAPKPLLMVNGEFDKVVPIKYCQDLIKTLQSKYSDHEKLKLNVHKVDHRVTSKMLGEVVDWFKKYL